MSRGQTRSPATLRDKRRNRELILSYARVDLGEARQLGDDLRKFSGLQVCFDEFPDEQTYLIPARPDDCELPLTDA